MEIKKFVKIILGVMLTILLGAIGSGVWERLLSPTLSKISNLITSSVASISDRYSDSIYSTASYLVSFDQSRTVHLLLFLFIFFGLFAYAIYSKKDNKILSLINKAMMTYCRGWSGIIFSGAFLIVIFFLIATDSTTREIRYYSTKNMEIVRPYIGEKQYLMLRSNYLSMNNKDDFKKFLENLYAAASTTPIKIKKFDPR